MAILNSANCEKWSYAKNTDDCDNDQRERDSTTFWNRQINSDCAFAMQNENKDPVAQCSFESQYASYHKYPIMFVGSMQDLTFFERHTCGLYDSAPAWEVSEWINKVHAVTHK